MKEGFMEKRCQTEVVPAILRLLGDYKVNEPDDLVGLIKLVKGALVIKPYNEQTKEHADSIQWKRTAAEIIEDAYVYDGKACSDLVMVLVALCKALGLEANLVKLVNVSKTNSHSIAEVKINGDWYRIDPSFSDPKPFKGRLEPDQIWNKDWDGGWRVWRRGEDLWSMGLDGIDKEEMVYRE